jgi:hypothetical protein
MEKGPASGTSPAAYPTWYIRSEMKRKSLDSDSSGPAHFLLGNVLQKERTARSSILTMRKPRVAISISEQAVPERCQGVHVLFPRSVFFHVLFLR